MKSVCEKHQQAYEVGEHCPWCEFPAAEPESAHVVKMPANQQAMDAMWLAFAHAAQQAFRVRLADALYPQATTTTNPPVVQCPSLAHHLSSGVCLECGWVRT